MSLRAIERHFGSVFLYWYGVLAQEVAARVGPGVDNLRAVSNLLLSAVFGWLLLSMRAGMVGMVGDGAMLNPAILGQHLLAGREGLSVMGVAAFEAKYLVFGGCGEMELFEEMVQLLGESAEMMPATTAASLLLPTTMPFTASVEAYLNPLHYFIINIRSSLSLGHYFLELLILLQPPPRESYVIKRDVGVLADHDAPPSPHQVTQQHANRQFLH